MDKEKVRGKTQPPVLIGMVCSFLIVLFGIYNICRTASQGGQERREYAAPGDMALPSEDLAGFDTQLPLPDTEVELMPFKKQNPDTVGWLYYPDFRINGPILQDDDNRYYARHTFSGERDAAGSIFLDCMASDDFDDMHTVVYGRGAQDMGMFGGLEGIREMHEEELSPYFWIFTQEGTSTYRVVSWYESDAEEDTFQTVFEDAEDYSGFLSYIQDRAEEGMDADLAVSDRILTLSTWTGGSSACLAVHGVLVGRTAARERF